MTSLTLIITNKTPDPDFNSIYPFFVSKTLTLLPVQSPLWSCLKSHNERFKVKTFLLIGFLIKYTSVIRSELIASKDGLSTDNIRRCYVNFFGKVSNYAPRARLKHVLRNLAPTTKLMSGYTIKQHCVVVTQPKTFG